MLLKIAPVSLYVATSQLRSFTSPSSSGMWLPSSECPIPIKVQYWLDPYSLLEVKLVIKQATMSRVCSMLSTLKCQYQLIHSLCPCYFQ